MAKSQVHYPFPCRARLAVSRRFPPHPRPAHQASAFTRWEAAIVGTVLLILAAVVVPQFSEATQDSRLSGLISDLQNVRTQIGLYRMQHRGKNPTLESFTEQMTQSTNSSGGFAFGKEPGFHYGPYLMEVPENPYTQSNRVTNQPPGPDQAWYYDEATGEFRTNDGLHDYL